MDMQAVFHGSRHTLNTGVPISNRSRVVVSQNYVMGRHLGLRNQSVGIEKCLKGFSEGYLLLRWNREPIIRVSNSNRQQSSDFQARENSVAAVSSFYGSEVFRGKSGSVSFHGLTHQLIEERKWMSAPFKEGKGSLLWIWAPIAVISSLILPQLLLGNAIELFLKDEILVEGASSLLYEVLFYSGLAVFLFVADRVQRPYLEYSSKRWSLITGLKGYLTSSFMTMGFKVIFPLFLVFCTWPVLGLPAVVAVSPFLVGCAAQYAFERILEKRKSSCWPVVPIIFEVYRLYQLTKASNFIERLMFAMKGLPTSPELMERSGALFALLVSFQVLGIVCLWSWITFLLRLFPSRPVAERY